LDLLQKKQKQQRILLLRKKYYKAERAKKRDKYVANKLREELMNNMTKTENISIKNIKDQLKKKNKFLKISSLQYKK